MSKTVVSSRAAAQQAAANLALLKARSEQKLIDAAIDAASRRIAAALAAKKGSK
jgi:hypothetical protein